MKFKLSNDARPQAVTLLVAALISIALWFIPFAEILSYPFRIFVTFIHEGGHALAALITGNSVRSFGEAGNRALDQIMHETGDKTLADLAWRRRCSPWRSRRSR